MGNIINIATIFNNRVKAMKKEFDLDKNFYEIELIKNNKQYNRTKCKKFTKNLENEYNRKEHEHGR